MLVVEGVNIYLYVVSKISKFNVSKILKDNIMFSKETYINRRKELKKQVGSGILLFLGNDECGMNFLDNTYPFRQDSSFLYYWGLNYANLNAIIDIDEDKEIIFGDELSIDEIVWMGTQPTLHEKSQLVGVHITEAQKDIQPYLQKVLAQKRTIHYLPTYRPEHTLKLLEWMGVSPQKQNPSTDFIRAVVNQRNYKTEEEVIEIEKACDITSEMHLTAMRKVAVGVKEYEVVAALEEVAYARNARLSFPTIATVDGQTLHNHYHGNIIRENDLFLIDAGAETSMGYAGDMSSTVPAGKRFTNRQREIYDIQVASHLAAVNALRPGIRFEEVYEISALTICEGMKSLGLMKGDMVEAVQLGAHAMFFQCGLGHMMGLDVHDMENLGEVWVGYDGKPKSTQFGRKSLRLARELEKDFVLTIEPGIYFIPELIDLWKTDKRFVDFINYDKLETYKDFGGIRNEEDYLITADGAKRLGKQIPLSAKEVEEYRNNN